MKICLLYTSSLVNFCEFDKYAAKSYCAIHGTSETLNLGDITKVDEKEIEPFNMICGGSPCQDFSPVSYTHLDVYKRQPMWCLSLQFRKI